MTEHESQDNREDVVEYQLDPDNRICGVNRGWDEFAEQNGAPHLFARHILGKPIRSFVTGDVTQMFVISLIDAVRIRNEIVIRPYRCDCPQFKRFMEMTVSPSPEGILTLSHRIVRIEPMRRALNFRQFQYTSGVEPKVYARCSMCNRIRGENQWLEPNVALPQPPKEIPVIYGVCPDCLAGVRRLRHAPRDQQSSTSC